VSQEYSASPDYSPFAREYAQSRPGYPTELYTYLVSLLNRHECAWDCATGNGQAARSLTDYFDRVIATDMSAEQIKHAAPHPRIEYRVTSSEDSGLLAGSVDLITVAAALHWFDLDRFFAEARRVLRPNGVLAAWTYHIGHMLPPFDHLFYRFCEDVLRPYFSTKTKLVDDRYNTIEFPGTGIAPIEVCMKANWTLDQMLGFIHSWSGTQQYIADHGEDPVQLIAEELNALWGSPQNVHELNWPLYLRIARV